MPPLNYIEISDTEGKSIQTIPPHHPIHALAIVADINAHIEEANSTIKTYKDDVVYLKRLLQSAEARLEKEQERRLGLIEEKNVALDSGVAEINARSGLGNKVRVGVKSEVKHIASHEFVCEVKGEEVLKEQKMGLEIGEKSIFLGVQVQPRAATSLPPVPAPRTNENWGDDESDGSIQMEGFAAPTPQTKPPKTTPTRGKTRRWRMRGGIGQVASPQRLEANIPVSAVPQQSRSFRREIISSAIGGQLQHTWPTPDQNGSYAIKVLRYCCLRKELNWCLPSRPGDTGFMYSARPHDWGGADFPLFIKQTSDWEYYGDYKITGSHTVSLQEWKCFKETQKTLWCKHMISQRWGRVTLAKHFQTEELNLMNQNDWKKVYDLFEKEDTNPRHLRITARKLEFLRYNGKLYDLLAGKTTSLQMPTIKKRKVTHDTAEVGFADDDYTPERTDDKDIPPQSTAAKRARRSRNRISYIEPTFDSEDNDIQPPELAPSAAPAAPTRSVLGPNNARIKEELLGDDNDLYSAPPKPQPARTSQALVQVHGGDNSSIEVWEKEPEPWVMHTDDNDMIAASDNPLIKFDANQLIRVFPPPTLDNLPKFPTTKFSRRFLSKVLGGCEQSQECVISEAKKKTQIYKLGVYYCERAEWSPDLPSKPGMHGVVYGTKNIDNNVDFNYSSYPVFCRRKVNEWEYCGEYQITRRDFVPGEWSRVAPVAKKSWSEGYAGRRGKWGINHMLKLGIIEHGQKVTAQDVLQFIEDGLLQMECQVYRCVGYNRELYDTLDAEWIRTTKNGLAMKQEILDDED